MLETIMLMSAIILLAFFLKGITGFGEALVAIPLLLLFYDLKFILPIFLIVGLSAGVFLAYKFRKDIHRKILIILGISSILGVVVGTFLLKNVQAELIKKVFSVFVILFALYMLFKKPTKQKISKVFGIIAGFFGGLLDAVFGTGGPPVVMYLGHANVKKAVFRATCVATLVVFNILRLISYSATGIMTLESVKIALFLLPAMVIGAVLGMKLHGKLNENVFKKFVSVVLIVIGIAILL